MTDGAELPEARGFMSLHWDRGRIMNYPAGSSVDSLMTRVNLSSVGVSSIAVLAVILGPLSAGHPLDFGIGVAAIAVVVIITRCNARLMFAAVGALLVFQRGDGLTPDKLIYLTGFAALSLYCIKVFRQNLSYEVREICTPLLRVSAMLGVYLGLTALISAHAGAGTSGWIRDVLPYIMLAASPIVGVVIGATTTPQRIYATTFVIGTIASVGYAFVWISRRGLTENVSSGYMLASLSLCISCLTLALVGTLNSRKKLCAILIALIPLCLLLTGSRSSTVVIAAFVGCIGLRRRGRVSPIKIIALSSVIAFLVISLIPVFAASAGIDPNYYNKRFFSATSFLNGSGRQDDQSYEQRRFAYRQTVDAMREHPLLGTGPGYDYVQVSTGTAGGTTLDSPLIVIAKFGYIGCFVFLVFGYGLFNTMRRFRRASGNAVSLTAFRAFLFTMICSLPFAAPTEDKGFALALLLLCASVTSDFVTHAKSKDSNDITENLVEVPQ